MFSPDSSALAVFAGALLLCLHFDPTHGFAGESLPRAEPPADAPTVVWQKDYSNEDWTDEHPCLIRAEDGGFYVVGTSNRRAGESRYRYRLWIWKLNARGDRIWARTPSIPGMPEGDSVIWSSCVCPDTERVIVAQESLPKTGAWLLRFDPEGAVTSCQALPLGRAACLVRSVEEVPGGFLLAGAKLSQKGDAWVMKVDGEGKEVWQRTYDRGQSEAAISLVAAPDGTFAFSADSGDYNKFGGGPSNVWVVTCDAKGRIVAEGTFEGRHPTLARSTDGSYAVAMNTEDFPALRMQVLGLDENLRKAWGPHEIASGAGLGLYPIAVDAGGDFVIAGAGTRALHLWKFTRSGQAAWATPIPSTVHCTLVSSFRLGRDAYVLAAAGKDRSPDRASRSSKADPNGHRDQFDILVVKVSAPEPTPQE